MEQLVSLGQNLYARDQWGRVWIFTLGSWNLTAAPPGTVWVDPQGAEALQIDHAAQESR